MLYLGLLSLAASLAAPPLASAVQLHRRDAPAVVGFDIQRGQIDGPDPRDLLKRDDQTVRQTLINEKSFYFCNVTIGTPGQQLSLVLDTGSSDLWCKSADSAMCSTPPNSCNVTGAFDADESSTLSVVSSQFNITYVDGTSASGDYVTDTLRISEATVEDFQFAVGYEFTSNVGVLGIGYPANEVSVLRFGKKPYPNLPKALVREGWIKSNAYSLWLNDLEASSGSILFGGVDTEKYYGPLHTLPVEKMHGEYRHFVVALTGIAFSSDSEQHSYASNTLPAAVLLDSGSTLTYLPNPIVNSIYSDLRVIYDPSSGNAFVPCSLADEGFNITYTFSAPTITVGISELVLNAGNSEFRDGTPACLFGIVPAGNAMAILGDTFLRSAYVVFDLENNEVSLANTNFNSMKSNILEIGSGPDSVPTATSVDNPVTSVTVGGGGGGGGSGPRIGGPTGSVTGLPSPSSSSDASLVAVPKTTGSWAWAMGIVWCLLGM